MLAADVDEAAAPGPRRRAAAARLRPLRRRGAGKGRPLADGAEVYRPQGCFSPVLRVDGVIRGVWPRDGDVVALTPSGRLAAAERAAAAEEAERLGATLTVRR